MTPTQNLILLADSSTSFRDLLASMFTDFLAEKQLFSADTHKGATDSANGLMSKEDLCREFGISSTTLTEWMKKGFVPYLRYDRRVYFERSAVLEAGRRHTKYMHTKGK